MILADHPWMTFDLDLVRTVLVCVQAPQVLIKKTPFAWKQGKLLIIFKHGDVMRNFNRNKKKRGKILDLFQAEKFLVLLSL